MTSGPTRVFVFCRPYLVPDFEANVAGLGPGFVTHFLTDGRRPGVVDTRARFYERLNRPDLAPSLDAVREEDIIARCRYLRNLPYSQALRMLRSMASVLREELEAFQPNVVLSHMVDDYVTHLLSELARERSVAYVGFAYSYFPGKVQVTLHSNGAPLDVREPLDDEVDGVLAEISQRTFRQNYLQKPTYSFRRHVASVARYKVKQIVFRARGLIESDPLHMHYGCLPFVVERRRVRDYPSSYDFHSDWSARLEKSTKPIVYVPLGYFPESTIDYWITDRKALCYEEVVIEVCRALTADYHVVVKEHLHMLGARSVKFFRRLIGIDGLTSVPPLEYSNDVLARATAVVIGGGSIGVESYIRGKPILSYCDTSYWFDPSHAAKLDLGQISEWPAQMANVVSAFRPAGPGERFEFVRQCIRSTMRTSRPGHRWPICDRDDLVATLNRAIRQT